MARTLTVEVEECERCPVRHMAYVDAHFVCGHPALNDDSPGADAVWLDAFDESGAGGFPDFCPLKEKPASPGDCRCEGEHADDCPLRQGGE